jgi:metal-responsive CopG/Arc/MetJ family transcriptional regulator
MKTITIKLPENQAEELNIFIKEKNYPSKSEFLRHLIMEKLETNKKEKAGFLILAEKSMKKIWDNKKDDKTWSKYL